MKPIRTILIANRGEIACRVARTAREMGIRSVAVFSDADAGAPHVLACDDAVRLPGNAPADTYLRGDLIVDAAAVTGADAVHPGYGFLSENAVFAAACDAAGLTFIGPSAMAIELMGSKVGARELMAAAGVPVLPGFTIEPTTSADDLRIAGGRIGFPVIVKASYGGGGRGMRVVREPGGLGEAVASAQREATAAFGNGSVFLERYLDAPRHIEVQVFGDAAGTVISLFERECSIQRRHQKIIEEAPSPAVTPELREQLCAAARAAASILQYVGAGTVEFVMDGDGAFFFLEVNTRLQVEHPVTEMITGLDLVRLQIEIAEGHPLPAAAVDARMAGHAIEARLYAEDVAAGFVPLSGTVHRLRVTERDGLRFDAGYGDGSTVSTYYDAMLGKVIAWAPTRREAAASLAAALAGAEIHGVATNRELLAATLRHPEFAAGRTDTAFYERHDPAALRWRDADADEIHAVAAALAPWRDAPSPQPVGIPTGWRNVGQRTAMTRWLLGDRVVPVAITRARDSLAVSVDGGPALPLTVAAAGPDQVGFELGGLRHAVRLHRVGEVVYADSARGWSTLQRVPRFPEPEIVVTEGSLVAPMPGTVVAVHAVIGDEVIAGQVLVALEAMKMEHAIKAPRAGTVSEVRVERGAQVERGEVLAVLAPLGGVSA